MCNTIKKLIIQDAISPIMGTNDEWIKLSDGCYQNVRCSGLIKLYGKCYYMYAIYWKVKDEFWFNDAEILLWGKKHRKAHWVKSFPFTPKTFTIDIEKKQKPNGEYIYYIKDKSQLNKAFEYYNEWPLREPKAI